MNLRDYVLLLMFARLTPKEFTRLGFGPITNKTDELGLYLDADQPPGGKRGPLFVWLRTNFLSALEGLMWKDVDELRASLLRLSEQGKLGNQKAKAGEVNLTVGLGLLQELGQAWARQHKPQTAADLAPLEIWPGAVMATAAHQTKERPMEVGWTNDKNNRLWLVPNGADPMEQWHLVDPMAWAKGVMGVGKDEPVEPTLPDAAFMQEKARHEFLSRLSWKNEALGLVDVFLKTLVTGVMPECILQASSAEDLAARTTAKVVEYFAGLYQTPEILVAAAPTRFHQALSQAILDLRKPKVLPLLRVKSR